MKTKSVLTFTNFTISLLYSGKRERAFSVHYVFQRYIPHAEIPLKRIQEFSPLTKLYESSRGLKNFHKYGNDFFKNQRKINLNTVVITKSQKNRKIN